MRNEVRNLKDMESELERFTESSQVHESTSPFAKARGSVDIKNMRVLGNHKSAGFQSARASLQERARPHVITPASRPLRSPNEESSVTPGTVRDEYNYQAHQSGIHPGETSRVTKESSLQGYKSRTPVLQGSDAYET